jgi:RNA polymerase sigma factor (TIGR02999 family)
VNRARGRGQKHSAGFSTISVPLMSDVTRVLSAIEQGDPHAAEQLLPLVYEELRKLAAQKLAQEAPGQTLQATALVHEAYLRLVDVEKVKHWDSRGHFFAAAAEAMRRILVDSARRRHSAKHGGQLRRIDFDEAQSLAEPPADDLLALNDALDLLAREDPVKAELVKLRCFAGLSHQDAAKVLCISRATADRYWAYAKSWLYCKLYEPDSGKPA